MDDIRFNIELSVIFSHQFKKDLKKFKQSPKKLALLDEIVTLLATNSQIPRKYKNHQLSGNYDKHFELHIQPDYLLIYKVKDMRELYLVRLGSHSELFKN